jgi:exodeoxyribonuclease VII large subunit
MSPIFDVSGAIAVLNQTLEYAYPTLTIVGEVSEFRVSKGKWVYLDLKDDVSKLRCFGTVFQLNVPIEDGMQVAVVAQPRLHNLYGFSLNIVSIKPVGEGSIKKAQDLLHAKLEKEGLFDEERKRAIPYPPARIALITSAQSAAFADFVKIIGARWPLLEIELHDVQVQGAQAEEDIVRALNRVNQSPDMPDAVLLIRGGGSADDLAAFSTESVTRAVSVSRVPTVVAIGHEVDTSLAELAADLRASTPSNAAELLVPDHADIREGLSRLRTYLSTSMKTVCISERAKLEEMQKTLYTSIDHFFNQERHFIERATLQLESYHPKQVLKHGYALVRTSSGLVKSTTALQAGDELSIEMEKRTIQTKIQSIKEQE